MDAERVRSEAGRGCGEGEAEEVSSHDQMREERSKKRDWVKRGGRKKER